MTPEQERAFREKGCVHIPGVLAKSVVLPVKDHVLNELKRLNIWSSGRTLSQKLKGVSIFQQTGKLGQLINYPGLNERLVSPALYGDMCHLADAPLLGQDGQLMISLPHKVAWSLAGLNWHRDVAQSPLKRIPGVQAFILLDNVAAHGGATLALAGSHRLANQSLAMRGISELTSKGANERVHVDGVELSLIEMCGRAGDLYLMDMRVLHTPSINATRQVRIMATARYLVS